MILFFLPFIWLISGVFILRFIGKKIQFKNNLRKSLILSFWFALIFGIGIVGGSNAEPGFALPAPIFISVIWDTLDGNQLKYIIRGTFYPFLFWWTLIFILSLINRYFK